MDPMDILYICITIKYVYSIYKYILHRTYKFPKFGHFAVLFLFPHVEPPKLTCPKNLHRDFSAPKFGAPWAEETSSSRVGASSSPEQKKRQHVWYIYQHLPKNINQM